MIEGVPAASSPMLKVISLEFAPHLAHTNFAYVNPQLLSTAKNVSKFIRINKKCIYTVQTTEKVPADSVGLSYLQRVNCRTSKDKQYPYEFVEIPKLHQELSTLVVEVAYSKQLQGVSTVIDGKELEEQFLQQFNGQVFSEDQKVSVDYDGQVLIFTVKQIQFFDTAVAEQNAEQAVTTTRQGATAAARISDAFGIFSKYTTLEFVKTEQSDILLVNKNTKRPPLLPPGWEKTIDFEKLGIGGMDEKLNIIFRRAFASRTLPPEKVQQLGIDHVKGIMLYGPPGTGKTLFARQIGKLLNSHKPVIVNGPDILSKWVGESEKKVRELFEPAEKEFEEQGENSKLHLIIFDEMDAIAKRRTGSSSGSGVGDNVVNQLLSKIDGVNQLNNILLIGMTNRLDLIDDALLRPGRFDLKIEIGLPNRDGRLQILKIHTEKMRTSNLLSPEVSLATLADETKNYTGADIKDLVKCAASYAAGRHIEQNQSNQAVSKNTEEIIVTKGDFEAALLEVKPKLGVATDQLETYLNEGIIDYGQSYCQIVQVCKSLVKQCKNTSTHLLSVLMQGQEGCGKTTLAAHIAHQSRFPFVKVISPETLVQYSTEYSKAEEITRVFQDAYKTPLSMVILDNLERLIEYVPLSLRFSNTILQTILVYLKAKPKLNRKIMVVATTSLPKELLVQLGIWKEFNQVVHIPVLTKEEEVSNVLVKCGAFEKESSGLKEVLPKIPMPIPIKKLLYTVEMARASELPETNDVEYTEKAGAKEKKEQQIRTVSVESLLQAIDYSQDFE